MRAKEDTVLSTLRRAARNAALVAAAILPSIAIVAEGAKRWHS